MKVQKKKLLLVDAEKCIGCFGCDAACRMEHDLPPGPKPFKVFRIGPIAEDGTFRIHHRAVTCFHCDQPACVSVCPTGAMQKREDGIVFSDMELCIGCQTCAVACPFGIPELNPGTGKIAKCDGCRERVDKGLWPACALKCPGGALSFGSPGDVVRLRRGDHAVHIVETFCRPQD